MNSFCKATATALVFALCLIGCGRSFVPATPPSFVELKDQAPNYDYRSITAEGMVLAIRDMENDPRGDLAFWVKAVEQRMRTLGGYALIDSRPVECQGGHK